MQSCCYFTEDSILQSFCWNCNHTYTIITALVLLVLNHLVDLCRWSQFHRYVYHSIRRRNLGFWYYIFLFFCYFKTWKILICAYVWPCSMVRFHSIAKRIFERRAIEKDIGNSRNGCESVFLVSCAHCAWWCSNTTSNDMLENISFKQDRNHKIVTANLFCRPFTCTDILLKLLTIYKLSI